MSIETQEIPFSYDEQEGSITFNLRYEAGHKYSETLYTTDYFCCHCGKQTVAIEGDRCDEDMGPKMHCYSCGGAAYSPSGARDDNWQDQQRSYCIKRALGLEAEPPPEREMATLPEWKKDLYNALDSLPEDDPIRPSPLLSLLTFGGPLEINWQPIDYDETNP